MKKYITKLGLLGLTAILFSCSKNEDETNVNDFGGYYKIQSISSSLSVDINNDGLKTNDYLQEVKSNYTSYNGEIINYGYDNELRHNFAEARPTENQFNNTNFLDIRFPAQRIDSIYQGNDNYVKMNMEYRKLSTSFIYKISNNNIEIESDPFDQFEYYAITNFEINRLNKNEFEIKFDLPIYDFHENDWITTRLTARYIKTL
ncbi:MAG: hypothetical protein EOP00_31055 [Pedobacter sp.]|nr:MAG: hypothetical protein EOP00_31055 [Pedobacter sp.]